MVLTNVRVSVFNLLVLIAVTAPGLALTRSLPDYLDLKVDVSIDERISGPNSWGRMFATRGTLFTTAGQPLNRRPSYWLSHVPYWAGPCLVAWTLAAMAVGSRGPGPHPRRLAARRPGLATAGAVILALVAGAIRCLQPLTVNGVPLTQLSWGRGSWAYFWITLPRMTGYTVAASWLALALSGRRSAEPGESAGLDLALGWCWIAMAVASELGVWCFALNY